MEEIHKKAHVCLEKYLICVVFNIYYKNLITTNRPSFTKNNTNSDFEMGGREGKQNNMMYKMSKTVK